MTSTFSPVALSTPKAYVSLVSVFIFITISTDPNGQLSICAHLSSIWSIVGNGVVIHLPGLFEEAENNEKKGKLNIFRITVNAVVVK